MSTTTTAQDGQSTSTWPAWIAGSAGQPIAAALGLGPALPDLIAKGNLQLREPVARLTFGAWAQAWRQISPTIATAIAVQMVFESQASKVIRKRYKWEEGWKSKLLSASVVGWGTSPFIGILNAQLAGQTLAQAFWTTMRPQILLAIGVQETVFLGGVTGAKLVSAKVKRVIGGNPQVDFCIDYASAFFSGAAGGGLGHPFNTIVTRWQNKRPIFLTPLRNGVGAVLRDLFTGAVRRSRATGIFSVGYTAGTDLWNAYVVWQMK